MTSKPKYEGKFNWHGEVLTYFRHAHSKDEAKVQMLLEMGKAVDRPLGVLVREYNGSEDNFKIRRVK
jgi:hypothetical protein